MFVKKILASLFHALFIASFPTLYLSLQHWLCSVFKHGCLSKVIPANAATILEPDNQSVRLTNMTSGCPNWDQCFLLSLWANILTLLHRSSAHSPPPPHSKFQKWCGFFCREHTFYQIYIPPPPPFGLALYYCLIKNEFHLCVSSFCSRILAMWWQHFPIFCMSEFQTAMKLAMHQMFRPPWGWWTLLEQTQPLNTDSTQSSRVPSQAL